jgi:hypothetical protein
VRVPLLLANDGLWATLARSWGKKRKKNAARNAAHAFYDAAFESANEQSICSKYTSNW